MAILATGSMNVNPGNNIKKTTDPPKMNSKDASADDDSALSQEEKKKKKEEEDRKSEEEIDVDGLVLLKKTVRGQQKDLGLEVTGTVVNRRRKVLSYAQITFNIYDETGAQVGSALANINGLEPGSRWNFKAFCFTKGTGYKFSKLSGY